MTQVTFNETFTRRLAVASPKDCVNCPRCGRSAIVRKDRQLSKHQDMRFETCDGDSLDDAKARVDTLDAGSSVDAEPRVKTCAQLVLDVLERTGKALNTGELAREIGKSRVTVNRYANKLVEQGRVRSEVRFMTEWKRYYWLAK